MSQCEKNSELIRCIMTKVKKLINGVGIPDAPSDGEQYARQDGSWTVISSGGGGNLQQTLDSGNLATDIPVHLIDSGDNMNAYLYGYSLEFIYPSTEEKTTYKLKEIVSLQENGDELRVNLGGKGRYYFPSSDEQVYHALAIASEISGTFANPTSITVTNGIITAIS